MKTWEPYKRIPPLRLRTPDAIADAICASPHGLVDPRRLVRGGYRATLTADLARQRALGGGHSVRCDHPIPERGESVYDYAARMFAWAQDVSRAEDADG